MYDRYLLKKQDGIYERSRTSHYYVCPKEAELDSFFIIPDYDLDKNFIFLNENFTDSYYLLNREVPSIDQAAKLILTKTKIESCFDIVFISNGEKNAEENYEALCSIPKENKVHWVKDIKGRNNAYKEAARQSKTRYFFAVFGKLEIDPNFNFHFGICDFDYRHYIFTSKNPVNQLEYGHQGLILYNKEKVLSNPGVSIDFTLSQLYRQIPICSGVARFNYSEKAAWRTAFRECIKLCMDKTPLSKKRLEIWQTGSGTFSEYSIKGARDAITFYEKFKDNPIALFKSYEWDWLDSYLKEHP